jgi:hypothetical protein
MELHTLEMAISFSSDSAIDSQSIRARFAVLRSSTHYGRSYTEHRAIIVSNVTESTHSINEVRGRQRQLALLVPSAPRLRALDLIVRPYSSANCTIRSYSVGVSCVFIMISSEVCTVFVGCTLTR